MRAQTRSKQRFKIVVLQTPPPFTVIKAVGALLIKGDNHPFSVVDCVICICGRLWVKIGTVLPPSVGPGSGSGLNRGWWCWAGLHSWTFACVNDIVNCWKWVVSPFNHTAVELTKLLSMKPNSCCMYAPSRDSKWRLYEVKPALPRTAGLGICWELITWSNHLCFSLNVCNIQGIYNVLPSPFFSVIPHTSRGRQRQTVKPDNQ